LAVTPYRQARLVDSLANEVVANRRCSTERQAFVVLGRSIAVGMSRDLDPDLRVAVESRCSIVESRFGAGDEPVRIRFEVHPRKVDLFPDLATPDVDLGVGRGARATIEPVDNAIAIFVEFAPVPTDGRAGAGIRTTVGAVVHTVAIAISRAAVSIDGDTGGRTRAAIDAIVHTVAVAVTLATKVVYVRTRCGAGAAVNTVGYAVTVSVHDGAAGTAKRKLQAETEYVVPEILAKQVVTALPILAPECYVAAAKNIRQEPDPAGNHQAIGVIRAV